jgi:hypothetical protein
MLGSVGDVDCAGRRLDCASRLPAAVAEWNANVERSLADSRVTAVLERLLMRGYGPRHLLVLLSMAMMPLRRTATLAKRATTQLRGKAPLFIMATDLADADEMLFPDRQRHIATLLSVPEAVLLVAAVRLDKSREERQPAFNLEMLLDQAEKFFRQGNSVHRCSKQTLRKAFEHLVEINALALGEVALEDCSGQGRTHVPVEFRKATLMLDPDKFLTLIKQGHANFPTSLLSWAEQVAPL